MSRLRIGDCDVVDLAKVYGTPLYVYDEDGLRETCRRFRSAFAAAWPNVSVAYACKAFATVAMLRLAHEEGLTVDVVSVGELALARRAGIPAENVTFHGVVKTDDELEAAVTAGVGHIVIDSVAEVDDVIKAAARSGRRQPVLVRISPDVDVATDRWYKTSEGGKFGLSIADGSAERATLAVLASEHLRLDGVHFHLGSQIMTARPYLDAMAVTRSFIARFDGWRPDWIVVGGGMGVQYGQGEPAPTPARWAESIVGAFRELLAPVCAQNVVLGIEPGRAMVAHHGTTLYTVGSVKRRADREVTVLVDGSLADNPRPLMYSATHEVVWALDPRAPKDWRAHIHGRSCETDLLFADVAMPEPRRGDVLAVRTTGAYVHCMASNYNRFQRPAVVFAKAGTSELVVRRETVDDLLRTELVG